MLDERVLGVLARLEAEDAAEREAGLPAGRAVTPGGGDNRAVPVRTGRVPGGDRGPGDRRLARVLVDLARCRSTRARRPSRLARARPGQVRGLASEHRRRGSRRVGRARRGRRSADAGVDRGTFDLVFLDAEKDDYETLFGLARPLLEPGGLVIADNVLSHAETLGAYSAARQADPTLSSVTVPLDRGLELSVVLCAST